MGMYGQYRPMLPRTGTKMSAAVRFHKPTHERTLSSAALDTLTRAAKQAGSAAALARALGYDNAGEARLRRAIRGDTANVAHDLVRDARAYLDGLTGDGAASGEPRPAPGRVAEEPADYDTADLIPIPTAPYGHGASFDGHADNTDAEDRVTLYHEDTLRQMLGGDVPRDAQGRVSLRLSFAVGDSMAPFIPSGAPFLYVEGGAFVDGARYALWLGPTQADVIKRVEVHGGGVVHLVSNNSAVGRKELVAGDEEGVWFDAEGRDYDLTIRGRVVWPLDTPHAVMGQVADRLTEFARSLLR